MTLSIFLSTLLLVFSAPSRADVLIAGSHAHDDDPETFSKLNRALDDVPEIDRFYQKRTGDILQTWGSRCIDGWSEYKARYDQRVKELGGEAREFGLLVRDLQRDLYGDAKRDISLVPEELTVQTACGDEGEKAASKTAKNLATLDKDLKKLEPFHDRHAALVDSGRGDLYAAGKEHFHRSFSCQRKSDYEDAARYAFSESTDVGPSGFGKLLEHILTIKDAFEKEKEGLTAYQRRLQALKKRCERISSQGNDAVESPGGQIHNAR